MEKSRLNLNSLLLIALSIASASFNVAYANKTSSTKLIHKYHTDPKATPKLIHSKFSSNNTLDNNRNVITSFREEWYEDNAGKIWYAWEEKQENDQGRWEPVNYGMIKQGFEGYVSIP